MQETENLVGPGNRRALFSTGFSRMQPGDLIE